MGSNAAEYQSLDPPWTDVVFLNPNLTNKVFSKPKLIIIKCNYNPHGFKSRFTQNEDSFC